MPQFLGNLSISTRNLRQSTAIISDNINVRQKTNRIIFVENFVLSILIEDFALKLIFRDIGMKIRGKRRLFCRGSGAHIGMGNGVGGLIKGSIRTRD